MVVCIFWKCRFECARFFFCARTSIIPAFSISKICSLHLYQNAHYFSNSDELGITLIVFLLWCSPVWCHISSCKLKLARKSIYTTPYHSSSINPVLSLVCVYFATRNLSQATPLVTKLQHVYSARSNSYPTPSWLCTSLSSSSSFARLMVVSNIESHTKEKEYQHIRKGRDTVKSEVGKK